MTVCHDDDESAYVNRMYKEMIIEVPLVTLMIIYLINVKHWLVNAEANAHFITTEYLLPLDCIK